MADIISKQLISVLMLQERPSSLAKNPIWGERIITPLESSLQDFRNIPELVAQDKTRHKIINNRYASLIT